MSFTHLIKPPKITPAGRVVLLAGAVDVETMYGRELKRIEKRAYDANRYKNRKAKATANARKWREANMEKFNASVRKWQDKNRDKVNELKRGWYWRHREEINAKKRAREALKRG